MVNFFVRSFLYPLFHPKPHPLFYGHGSPLYQAMSTKPTEVRAYGAQLLAASKLIGKYCDDVNDEFILCKAESENPVHCVKIGRKVTECALRVYVIVLRP